MQLRWSICYAWLLICSSHENVTKAGRHGIHSLHCTQPGIGCFGQHQIGRQSRKATSHDIRNLSMLLSFPQEAARDKIRLRSSSRHFQAIWGIERSATWLASRHRALSIIEGNYSSLANHQENIAESNGINAATAKR